MKSKEFQFDFENPLDLVRSINPQMPAEQAVAQIQEFNRREFNKTKTPVVQVRRELLEKNGYNPDDWVYFSNTLRLEEQTDEDMMEMLARSFPPGVEFLVIQGDFIGGVSGVPGVTASWGVAKYKYNPDGYTVFIRVRPKQLEGEIRP